MAGHSNSDGLHALHRQRVRVDVHAFEAESVRARFDIRFQAAKVREGTTWRFRKRAVLANVPSFQFVVPGNIRMYPRSGFWCWGTFECTLVPVFGTWELREKLKGSN